MTSDVPAIPDDFVGAWRRVSIRLGDRPPDEPCDVMWLQGHAGFADLRLPRRSALEPVAFAGVTTWDPPALTWHHRLDLTRAAPDVGIVEWRGDDLVERGVADVGGEPTCYEEVWRREPEPVHRPIIVLTSTTAGGECRGTLVRVGDHAIVMARSGLGVAVRRDHRMEGTWRLVGRAGSAGAGLPAIPDGSPGWQKGDCVPLRTLDGACVAGDSWRVHEFDDRT